MYESKKQYHYGTGRRKSSIARVRVYENGTGSIIICLLYTSPSPRDRG